MRSLFFFNLDYVVPPGLCSQSSWAACVLLGAPRLPWAAPEHGCFVLVNLQGCQFSRFLSVRAGRKVERAGKGAGGRRDAALKALPARNAASGQRATLPLCCSVPQGWAAPSQPRFPPGERLCSPVRLLSRLSSALRASP